MAFIHTVSEQEAEGEVADLYQSVRNKYGSVTHWARAFSGRPDVLRAWSRLIATIMGHLDQRSYELATVAAAKAIQHTGCTLAHAERLLEGHLTPQQLLHWARGDLDQAGLSQADIALIEFAEAVASRAHGIEQADIDRLRQHGFSDTQIFDIASAAAARCFFSKLLDAVGALPDPNAGGQMDPGLRKLLALGRPVPKAPGESR